MQTSRPQSEHVNYFCYGSNMSRKRLAAHLKCTVDEFGFGESVVARSWDLVFDKKKKDGTAAANIVQRKDCSVAGVLYILLPRQWQQLKASEGDGYREQPISVRTEAAMRQAVTLIAVRTEEGIRPSKEYVEKIIAGAREHNISEDYIAGVIAKANE